MVRGALELRTALAEDPVLDLAHELGAFFHDRLVSRAVDVVGLESCLFEGVHHLLGGDVAGLAAEFFGDRHAHGGRGMGHDDVVLVVEHLFDDVDERHLLNGVERARDQTLAAGEAALVVDLVLGAETAFDGADRANLAAGVAGFAEVFVDFDNASELTLADDAIDIRTLFAAGVSGRREGLDLENFSSHLTDLLIAEVDGFMLLRDEPTQSRACKRRPEALSFSASGERKSCICPGL